MPLLLFKCIHAFLLQFDITTSSTTTEVNPLRAVLLITVAALFLYMLIKILRSFTIVDAHWHHHFDQLQFSSQAFYELIESQIQEMKMPGVSINRVKYSEGGILSANREYLRIMRSGLVFDICAAPFGRGFFISWWLGNTLDPFRKFVSAIPIVGATIDRALYKKTYFQIDTEKMFQESLHQNLLMTVDAITKENGIRQLSDAERNPNKGRSN